MLRAVIPVADLSGVLSQENPKYVGKSFPKIKQTGPSCTVIEVLLSRAFRNTNGNEIIFKERKPTIGVDLGDRPRVVTFVTVLAQTSLSG